MKKTFFYFGVLMLLSISCKKEKSPSLIDIKSGYFILSKIDNSSSLKSTNDDTNETTFQLGDIKASKEFFFILSNGGNEPISNITITSNNSSINVWPNKISKLVPNSKEEGIVIPLISIGFIHGTQLNGIGYTDLLKMGTNSGIITLTGKTLKGKDSITIQANFTFTVNAKLMDISLFENGLEIDLLKSNSSVNTTLGGLGFVRFFKVTSDKISISNIGNVDITCTTFSDDYINKTSTKTSYSILSNSVKEIPILSNLTYFELDSKGTIANDSKIQLGNNGKGYFAIVK